MSKKYTTKELKMKWVEYCEDHPIDENYNQILAYICWLDSQEEASK